MKKFHWNHFSMKFNVLQFALFRLRRNVIKEELVAVRKIDELDFKTELGESKVKVFLDLLSFPPKSNYPLCTWMSWRESKAELYLGTSIIKVIDPIFVVTSMVRFVELSWRQRIYFSWPLLVFSRHLSVSRRVETWTYESSVINEYDSRECCDYLCWHQTCWRNLWPSLNCSGKDK